jgi:hypothetical protein
MQDRYAGNNHVSIMRNLQQLCHPLTHSLLISVISEADHEQRPQSHSRPEVDLPNSYAPAEARASASFS